MRRVTAGTITLTPYEGERNHYAMEIIEQHVNCRDQAAAGPLAWADCKIVRFAL